MHKFCANCGNPVTTAQKFCTECGTVNLSYEGAVAPPTQARTAILKELEDATLQKVDELRRLREYQQRIHNVPIYTEPERVHVPIQGSTNVYIEQETIRLQKLELLVKMEEDKLDVLRQKMDKEPINRSEPTPIVKAPAMVAAPIAQPVAIETEFDTPSWLSKERLPEVIVTPVVEEQIVVASPQVAEQAVTENIAEEPITVPEYFEPTITKPIIQQEAIVTSISETPIEIETIIEPIIITEEIREVVTEELVVVPNIAQADTVLPNIVLPETAIENAITVIEEVPELATIVHVSVPEITLVENQVPFVEKGVVKAPTQPQKTLPKANPKSRAAQNIELQKRVKRNLSIAAIALIVIGGLAASIFAYPSHSRTGNLPKQNNVELIRSATPISNSSSSKGIITNSNAVKTVEQPNATTVAKSTTESSTIVYSNQWEKLQQLNTMIAKDLKTPKYGSMPWLISMHKNLVKVNLLILSQEVADNQESKMMLRQVTLVNDSVQWLLLKYCMQHPTEMAHANNYLALATKSNDSLNINSMYASMVNPMLKRQGAAYYKQAVIRYTRNQEELQLVTK